MGHGRGGVLRGRAAPVSSSCGPPEKAAPAEGARRDLGLKVGGLQEGPLEWTQSKWWGAVGRACTKLSPSFVEVSPIGGAEVTSS